MANQIQHPRNIYVREDAILPRLDAWLGGLFDPENLDATVAALAAAGDDTTRAQIEHAERTLADCKQRLARYRAALEAGTDPAIIAQWSAEVQAKQARAENDLKRARQAHAPPPSRSSSIGGWHRHSRHIAGWGRDADPASGWLAHVRSVVGQAR